MKINYTFCAFKNAKPFNFRGHIANVTYMAGIRIWNIWRNANLVKGNGDTEWREMAGLSNKLKI